MSNLICKYYISEANTSIKICNKPDLFESIIYNGKSIDIDRNFTFPTKGEQTLEFVLKNKTTIGDYAFADCDSLTSVVIPDSVTTIGDYAFYGCTSLTSIELPNSVTVINGYAFQGCTSLTSIELPNSVTAIGKSAFNDCTSLTSIVIPDSVTTIGDYAFADCASLTSIELPNSLTVINGFAFQGCASLTSIVIPNSVTAIGDNAFADCTSLKIITSNAVTAPSIEDYTFKNVCIGGKLYYPEGSDYSTWLSTEPYYLGYYSWKDSYSPDVPITPSPGVPDFRKIICTYYISEANTPIKICDNVLSFNGIFYDDKLIEDSQYYTFNEVGEHTLEFVLKNKTIIGDYAFAYCDSLTSVVIPDSVTTIGDWVFTYCTSLTPVVIPDSVTTIGKYSFSGCMAFTSITIPDSVTTIDNGAFAYCDSLTSVVVPDSVTTIGINLFNVCTALKSATLPKNITIIPSGTFSGCYALEEVSIPNSVTIIDGTAFKSCPFTSIIIPESVTTLGKYAFQYCRNLNKIEIKAPIAPSLLSTKTFEEVATGGTLYYPKGSDYSSWLSTEPYYLGYYGWNGVEIEVEEPDTNSIVCKYYISEANTSIKICDNIDLFESITYNGESIAIDRNFTFPKAGENILYFTLKNNTVLGLEAFYGCESLKSVSLPNTITTIRGGVFYNCTSLENIDFPDSVELIGSNAFYKCSSLTSISIPENVYYISSGAFNDCSNLREIDIAATEAPSIENDVFKGVASNGTLYYPEGSDYSSWLSTEPYYLGYHGWNTSVEPDEPDTPVEPEEPTYNPSVIISKNQMNLDNVGDSSNVQVTYLNVENVVAPDVPEGFEIEEVSRTETAGVGIQIVYKVKRITANKVDAQINFSGTSADGAFATSGNLTVQGDAIPAEVSFYSVDDENGVLMFRATETVAEVHINAKGAHSPYEFSYEIDGNGITCTYDQFNYEYEDGEIEWKYEFTSIDNDSNKPYTGTITFKYKDELTNKSITVPFYVGYANEGDIHSFASVYKFDKDGNRVNGDKAKTISVGYGRIQTINTPVIEGDWIHLGSNPKIEDYKAWVGDEYVKIGDKYTYDLTIDANSGNSRIGSITFSGVGIDGRDYEEIVEFSQEGTDTVKPIDEGFIELQQLSVAIMADGGAQTFKVKYYDVKEILPFEMESDWATITEVSRTEPESDVAWNGKECESFIVTYKATASPTEIGRQMKVKFYSILNSNIKMVSTDFMIYQLAEGSTEVQGSVTKLRGSGEYYYYGTPVDFQPEVGYINVVAEDPIISESWCRVAEIVDKSGRDYDYIKAYYLELDENKSQFSRECTITFRGAADDGTYIETSMKIFQQGQDEVIDEGEYENYKAYFMDFEGFLHSVSFITNPRSNAYGNIALAGNSPVIVSYTESGKLYEPLRTSTCTVKVVSSSYLMNLYSGKARGTQVVLKNEETGEVEWCGFMQPNLYNQGFVNCVEEIEFVASDCISTLQYLRYEHLYDYNGPMIVNYKEIIDYIMDECKMIDSYIFTQKLYTDSEEVKVIDFDKFFISENNFYSEEGEAWTLKEVLEETCKYFGFVCFQWGNSIYFMDYDEYQNNKQMNGIKYARDGYYWKGPEYVLISNEPNAIVEESYRETGADISLDDIFNKVSVNCNYYDVKELIPDIFEDDLLEIRNEQTLTGLTNRATELSYKTNFIVYDHKNIDSQFYLPIKGDTVHETKVTPTEEDFNNKNFFKTYVGGNIVDMTTLTYNEINKNAVGEPKGWEKYLMISQLNRPWCKGAIVGETMYWEDYNLPIMEFKNLPQIFIDNTEETFNQNTAGRVPETGSSSGGILPRRTTDRGFGSSSSTPRGDRNDNTHIIQANKGKHYLVLNAEAAFTDDFNVPYVLDTPQGFGKWSNTQYGAHNYDTIRDTYSNVPNFTPALTFYLEIPAVGWWNGAKWVDNETWFEVPLEELDSLKNMWYNFVGTKNNVPTNFFLGKTGYKIELPEKMESTSFMRFKIGMPKRFAHVFNSEGGDDNGRAGNAYCFIKNLEMNIVSKNTSIMLDNDIIFENVIDDNNVVDGPEISLKITSDNNINYSFSTVSTTQGSNDRFTTNFRFYDKEYNPILPEEAIIERYVNQYSTPSLKENVTLDMSFKPTQLITDTYWGDSKNFVIVGQELDYKQCSQRITLLEKK